MGVMGISMQQAQNEHRRKKKVSENYLDSSLKFLCRHPEEMERKWKAISSVEARETRWLMNIAVVWEEGESFCR